MLKNLVKDLKPSSTLAINETSKILEEQGKKIFKFGFGQSPFKIPLDIVEELKSNAHQNQYLSMQGLSKYGNAKKSGFEMGDLISEFKIENSIDQTKL